MYEQIEDKDLDIFTNSQGTPHHLPVVKSTKKSSPYPKQPAQTPQARNKIPNFGLLQTNDLDQIDSDKNFQEIFRAGGYNQSNLGRPSEMLAGSVIDTNRTNGKFNT